MLKTTLRFVTSVIAVVVFSGCVASTPPAQHSFQETKVYNRDYDAVWAAIIEVFSEKHIVIHALEKNSGVITTVVTTFPSQPKFPALESEYADCGAPGGFSHHDVIRGRLSVFVKKLAPGQCSVRLNTEFKAVRKDTDVIRALDSCKSKGKLEASFFSDIGRKLGEL